VLWFDIAFTRKKTDGICLESGRHVKKNAAACFRLSDRPSRPPQLQPQLHAPVPKLAAEVQPLPSLDYQILDISP
jgi:hypothetical protein